MALETTAVLLFTVALYVAVEIRRLFRLIYQDRDGFNALYPVFSRDQIDACVRDLRAAKEKYETLSAELRNRSDFKTFAINEGLRTVMRECCLAEVESERLRKLNAMQIEGNAGVFNGLRGIEEVKKEFSTGYFDSGTVSRAWKLCDDWIARLQSNHGFEALGHVGNAPDAEKQS